MRDVFDTLPTFEHRDARSSLRVWSPRPNVAVTCIEGVLTSEVAERFVTVMDPVLARGAHVGLHDWTGVTEFEASVPPRLTAWCLARIGKLERLVMATNHPIVSM